MVPASPAAQAFSPTAGWYEQQPRRPWTWNKREAPLQELASEEPECLRVSPVPSVGWHTQPPCGAWVRDTLAARSPDVPALGVRSPLRPGCTPEAAVLEGRSLPAKRPQTCQALCWDSPVGLVRVTGTHRICWVLRTDGAAGCTAAEPTRVPRPASQGGRSTCTHPPHPASACASSPGRWSQMQPSSLSWRTRVRVFPTTGSQELL